MAQIKINKFRMENSHKNYINFYLKIKKNEKKKHYIFQ